MGIRKPGTGTAKNNYMAGDRIEVAGVVYKYHEEFKRFELQERSDRVKKIRNFIPSYIYTNCAGTWSCAVAPVDASTPRAVVLLFARSELSSAKKNLELLRKDYVRESLCVDELENFLSETKSKSKK